MILYKDQKQQQNYTLHVISAYYASMVFLRIKTVARIGIFTVIQAWLKAQKTTHPGGLVYEYLAKPL